MLIIVLICCSIVLICYAATPGMKLQVRLYYADTMLTRPSQLMYHVTNVALANGSQKFAPALSPRLNLV